MMSVYGRRASGLSSHDSTGCLFVSAILGLRSVIWYLCYAVAVDIRVQLFEQVARMFCPISAQMFLLEEEVDAQVCLADYGRVLDGEVADAGQHEVLERLEPDDTGARVYEEDVCILKRDLPVSSPQTELTVVPAVVSWCGACGGVDRSLLLLRGRALDGRGKVRHLVLLFQVEVDAASLFAAGSGCVSAKGGGVAARHAQTRCHARRIAGQRDGGVSSSYFDMYRLVANCADVTLFFHSGQLTPF
jgi:hypothetical protein